MNSRTILVNDRMQRRYAYVLSEPEGHHFDPGFRPELSPKQMLELGVFGGKYMKATPCADTARLYGWRPAMPQTPAPGPAALGIRQQKDLTG